MEAKDVLELATEFVTWVLVIVGWMIVSDQQESREVAKTGYDRIIAARESFREVERKAISFHTQAFNEEAMHSLMRLIAQASQEMTYLRKHGFIGLGTSQRTGEVRKAVSGENFDPATHQVQERGSDLVIGIEAACTAIDRELLDSAHRVTSSPRTLRESLSTIFRWKMV